MKKIEAVIRPERLEDVKTALAAAGYPGLMVTRIEGHGKQKGLLQQFRGRQYRVDLLPKFKVEVICVDGQCGPLLDAIVSAGRTGEVGDGKVFVSEVVDVVRIRTGETGEGAV